MSKSIIISERDNIAALTENNKVIEFFIHRGDVLLGDIYLAQVENVLPSIDAAFVNVGTDKMGFLHASDVIGKGALKDLVQPKQKLIVQAVKEPTGHKGPRVTTSISLPGRFLVLMPQEKGINVSRKIASSKEKARLKSIVSLLKPPGVGVIIRTEAEGQSEAEIQEDLEFLLEKWNNVVTAADTVTPPNLLYRDQDLLYRVIREACTEDVSELVVDTSFAYHRATQLLQSWNISHPINVSVHKGTDSILVAKGIEREIRNALQTKVNLPSGGYIYIQTTEALTVVDVNSGKFVSSATQDETIRKTNLESVEEIARQLRLRNIGGMIIVDFIDMENRVDQLAILEQFELALEPDKSKPQIGQLSDLGLVELTRHRQGQSLSEIFTKKCPACSGNGLVIEDFNFATPPQEGEMAVKAQKIKHFKGVKSKPNQPEQRRHVPNQQQSPSQQFQNQKIKPNIHRKIESNPSLKASVGQQQNKQKVEGESFLISDELVKEFLAEQNFIPNVSKLVQISAVPPEVARKNLGRNYVPDVFTILKEIEAITDRVNEVQPEMKQASIQFEKEPAAVSSPKIVTSQKTEVVEQVQEIKKEEKPAEPEVQPVKEEEKVSSESEEQKEPVEQEEAPPKKPVRRGRRPKSETDATKKTTRTTRTRKTSK